MTDDEIALWLITKGTMEDKPTMAFAADRILALRAERDRLRAALIVYADPCDATETNPCGYEGNLCCRIARAALKGETP